MLSRRGAVVATVGFLRGEPQDCNQSLCQKRAPRARLQLIQPNNKQQITAQEQSPQEPANAGALFLSSAYAGTSPWFKGWTARLAARKCLDGFLRVYVTYPTANVKMMLSINLNLFISKLRTEICFKIKAVIKQS